MSKNSRALRRYHRNRIKNKRLNEYENRFLESNETQSLIKILKSINTPKACSCFMCGNPRMHFKELTSQELRYSYYYVDYENVPLL